MAEELSPAAPPPSIPDPAAPTSAPLSSHCVALSAEREFIENLLCQRVNFMLVFCGLVVTGALSGATGATVPIVLTLGTAVTAFLVPPISRAQLQLDGVMDEITQRCHGHPVTLSTGWTQRIIDEVRAGKTDRPFKRPPFLWTVANSRRGLVGYWVPLICVMFLALLAAWQWYVLYAATRGP